MSDDTVDALPDRRLTETEVKALDQSDRIAGASIMGRFLNTDPYIVEDVVITLDDGREERLHLGEDGWVIEQPINERGDS